MSVYNASWTRRLGSTHYDACAVDSTDYAASYTTSTGALPMGQEKTLLDQRVYKTMKRIRQEILHHCTTISIYLV